MSGTEATTYHANAGELARPTTTRLVQQKTAKARLTFRGVLHGVDAEAVLKKADAALYRAKAEGRNTFCFAPQGLRPLPPRGQKPALVYG